jgi:hypothetical protein
MTLDANLIEAFRFHRGPNRACKRNAKLALESARKDVAAGKRRYTSATYPKTYANPFHDSHGFKLCAWIENVSTMRRVGTFAEIMRKNDNFRSAHDGWYLSDDNWDGETAVPVVYQLPARNGAPFFAYGYDDWNNPGSAFLCFANDAEDELEAARFADQLTERMAETERDYRRAWEAGNKFVSLADDIKEARNVIRTLAAELLQWRKQGLMRADSAICQTLRDAIERRFDSINEARAERETLFSDYGREPGFQDAL